MRYAWFALATFALVAGLFLAAFERKTVCEHTDKGRYLGNCQTSWVFR